MTQNNCESNLAQVISIYKEQIPLYEGMFALSRQQKEVVLQDDFKNLNKLIQEREKIIGEIEQKNQSLSVYKDAVKEELGLKVFSVAEILAKGQNSLALSLQKVLDQLGIIIREIKKMDDENENLLKNKINFVREKMQEVKSKKQVSKAYSGIIKQSHGAFFDSSR